MNIFGQIEKDVKVHSRHSALRVASGEIGGGIDYKIKTGFSRSQFANPHHHQIIITAFEFREEQAPRGCFVYATSLQRS